MGPELTSLPNFLPGSEAALSLDEMRAKKGVTVSAIAFAIAATLAPRLFARSAESAEVASGARAPAASSPGSRPKVVLDQLDLAKAPLPSAEEKYLRDVLAKEARRADWGAGRKSRIQYRFRIDELEVVEEASVVRVRCTATGWLPRGKTAKSRLAFGGAPKERPELVRRVLAIVAHGVITRLADLERERRNAPVTR